ncbi:MAG: GNAT family N-acetyltransferase [Halobacteriovorax sp.]|nr:GNAT family N-acetyltransferase [Halobacteriovorax sp.]
MKLNIINANRSHFEFILNSQISMALETEALELREETVRSGVTAVFEDPSKGRYLVAELEEKPVGVLLIVTEWSEWRNSTVYWIHSLFIKKEYRGQGIYKRMYEHIKEEVLNDPRLAGIRLNVDKRNKDAVKVYEALGMSDEHYRMFEWLK